MGALPFVFIQLIMVSLIIAFPGIVSRDKPQVYDLEHVEINIPSADFGTNSGFESFDPDAKPGEGAEPEFEEQNLNDDAPLEIPKD
jgi:GntP family gluconate:H+ symporter